MNLYRRCLLSNVSLCVTRATSQLGDTLVRNTLGHHLCTRNICVSPAASLRGVSALKLAPLPCVTVRGHCVPSNERGAVRGKLVMKSLPYFCRGEVIRGFGRGSKELGIPTGELTRSKPAYWPRIRKCQQFQSESCVSVCGVFLPPLLYYSLFKNV